MFYEYFTYEDFVEESKKVDLVEKVENIEPETKVEETIENKETE
jgi:hypothetical protein